MAKRFEGGDNPAYEPRVRFASPLIAALVTLSGGTVGAIALTSACTSTTAINTALVTNGVHISTELLLGENLSCGTGTDDVYNYVAVVIGVKHNILAAGLFDCFADGFFANLPGTDAGEQSFAVWIYAYNQADFTLANRQSSLVNGVSALGTLISLDGSVIQLPASAVPDGGPVKKFTLPADLASICRAPATWVTECSATSQAGVEVLAACNPLQLEGHVPGTCDLPIELPDAGRD